MNDFRINVAIIGAVSAGKSTLLNSLFVEQYSDMKIKRTTMLPQVYQESTSIAFDYDPKFIRENNKRINDELINKTESGYKLQLNDIVEIEYQVPKIYNFVKLRDGVSLSIYDIPGLNDSRTKDVYYEYLTKNFHKFDIIIFVVDVMTAFNTMDEIDILNHILKNIRNNKDKYNIENNLIVLVNKCDDIYPQDGKLRLEPELEKMFEQANVTIKSKVNDICCWLKWYILPISCENSFIYRIYKRNPSVDLDIKYVNKIGYIEFGKMKWNSFNDTDKIIELRALFDKEEHDNRMEFSGFNRFRCIVYELLLERGLYTCITNRVKYELDVQNGGKDMNQLLMKLYESQLKINSINNFFNSKYENGINELVKKRVNDVINNYNSSITKYVTGYPKNKIAFKKYMNIKSNYDEIEKLFPDIWYSDKEYQKIYSKISNNIDKYYLNELESVESVEKVIELIDGLIDNNYENWKHILISCIGSKIIIDSIDVLDPNVSLTLLNMIQSKYDLNTDEIIKITSDSLYYFYKKEIKDIRNYLLQNDDNKLFDLIKLANFLEIANYWNNILVSTSNKYYKPLSVIKNLLKNFVQHLHDYDEVNSINLMDAINCANYDTKIEKYLVDNLIKGYSNDVCLYDDIIKAEIKNRIKNLNSTGL